MARRSRLQLQRSTMGAAFGLMALFVLPSLLSPAAAAPTPTADYAVSVPFDRYLDIARTVVIADNAFAAEQGPEILVSSQGLLVVSYLNYSYPVFTVIDPSDWSVVRPPFFSSLRAQPESWNSLASNPRGSAVALDSRDHLLRVYLGTVSGRTVPFYRVFDLTGSTIRAETQIGVAAAGDTSSYGVTAAENDTFLIVRATSNPPTANRTRIALDKVAFNSTLAFTNMTLFNDSSQNLYPHIVRDAANGRYLVSWVNASGYGRAMAIRADGSTVWGPVVLGSTTVTPSIAVTSDGGSVAAWATATQVHALKLNAAGAVEVADTVLRGGLAEAQGARAVSTPDGDVFVTWNDLQPTDGDLRAIGISPADLSVVVSATMVTMDDTPSAQARPIVASNGDILLAWANQTWAAPLNADIYLTQLAAGASGFDVRTPVQSINLPRGDHLDIPVSFSSLALPEGEYRVGVSASNFRGPYNWTVSLRQGASPAGPNFTLGPGEATNFTVSVDPPLIDPAGYGAYVNFAVYDARRPAANATLSMNITVIQGHRFSVAPADLNATVLPGASIDIPFSFRNNGTIAEAGLPLIITAPPPPGWTAVLSPSTFGAAAGASVDAVLSVTLPANATSSDKFCARVRVQSSSDPYAVGSAGFCVQTALVVDPTFATPAVSVSLDPGASAPANFTVGNTGNAGNGVVCHLAIVETLPGGWSAVGNPADFNIPRNTAQNVSISLRAPSDALGGFTLALSTRAWCDGSSVTLPGRLDVTVNEVHKVLFKVGGSTVDTDAEGSTHLNVTIENLGNTGERIVLSVSNLPLGWTATHELVVGVNPATEVPPYATGVFRFDVQAPVQTQAGSYAVNFTLDSDAGAVYAAAFTVRVPKTYGISAPFAPTNASAAAAAALSFEAPVHHLGNTGDSYTLRVDVAAPQVWIWKAEFVPDGAGSGSYFGSTLALEAFASGRLFVNLTVPREPFAGDVSVSISLTSTRGPSQLFSAPIRILLPDYSLEIVSVPGAGGSGVTVRVWNHGNFTAEPLAVRVYLDGRASAAEAVGLLAPGESKEVFFAWEPGPGDHTVAVAVDPTDEPGAHPVSGRIFESDERNNGATQTFSIEGPAQVPPEGGGTTGGFTTAPRGDALVVALLVMGAGAAALVAFLVIRRRHRPE